MDTSSPTSSLPAGFQMDAPPSTPTPTSSPAVNPASLLPSGFQMDAPVPSVAPVQSQPNQGMNIPQIPAPFPASPSDNSITAPLKTIGNIPSDAVNFITGAINTLNPVNIAKNLSDAYIQASNYGKQTGQSALSVIAKSFSQTPSSAVKVLVPQFFQKLASGDVQGALNINTNNPVQTWAPLLLLAKAGADHAGMGDQFDNAVKTITKPVTDVASSVGDAAGKVIGKAGGEATGFTTGQGAPVIGEAFKSGQDIAGQGKTPLQTNDTTAFNQSMRGNVQPSDIVDTAIQAAQKVVDARSADYVNQMKSLGLDTKNVDVSSIGRALSDNLSKFKVNVNADGSLDFSNSPIRNNPSAVGDIKTVYEDVTKTIGTEVGDKNVTPNAVALDSLKKSTGMVYSATSPARAFVTDIQNTIGQTLKDQVPGYSKMTADYADASNFLKDFKQSTGVSNVEGKVNYNTALTKLTSAMRQNNDFRLSLIKEMQDQTGTDITGQIGGTSSSSLLPRGLVSRLGLEGGIGAAVLHLINPATLVGLLSTSPRVVGEFVQGLGFGTAKTASFLQMLNNLKVLTSPAAAIQKQNQ